MTLTLHWFLPTNGDSRTIPQRRLVAPKSRRRVR